MTIIVTKEGYQAILRPKDDGYQATVVDRTIPRCFQCFRVPVKFGSAFTVYDLTANGLEWSRSNVQLVKVGYNQVLFVGKLGLPGGGASHSCSSCPTYTCSSCGYYCPNGMCYDYCSHRNDHQCAQRQAAQRREEEQREERRREAHRERQRRDIIQREREDQERRDRENAERERRLQEQLRQQRIREQREQRERERQEQLRLQREREERERQARLRREAEERRREEAREAEERAERERLRLERERLERERQQRLQQKAEARRRETERQEREHRAQLERIRLEQLRIARENEEREAIKTKFQHVLLRTSTVREDEMDYVSEDETLDEISEMRQTDVRAVQQEGPLDTSQPCVPRALDCGAPLAETKMDSELLFGALFVNSESLKVEFIDDSFAANDVLTTECWYKQVTVVESNSSKLVKAVLKRLRNNVEKDFERMEQANVEKDKARKIRRHQNNKVISPEDKSPGKQSWWSNLRGKPDELKKQQEKRNLRRERRRDKKRQRLHNTQKVQSIKDVGILQLEKAVARNLSKASLVLQQSILEYVFRGGKLQTRTVKRYPVFRWIEQSLIIEIVSYPHGNTDPVLLDMFRNSWYHVKEQFEWQQRRDLLYSLRTKQLAHELTLVHLNDILDLVQQLREEGLNIMCSMSRLWYRELKRLWLIRKVSRLDYEEDDQAKFIVALVDMPWSTIMTQQFLNAIAEEQNVQAILNILSTIRKNHVPNSLVLHVIFMGHLATDGRIASWTKELDYYVLINNLYKQSPSIARVVDAKIGQLLRNSNLGDSLERFIVQHRELLEQRLATFSQILEHIYTYQTTPDVWDKVNDILRKEKNPENWVGNVDQVLVDHLFSESHEFTPDELIGRIEACASGVEYARRDTLENAMKLFHQAYNSPAASLENSSSFMAFASMFSAITITSSEGLQKFTRKPISKWEERDIRLWAAYVKSNPTGVTQSEMVAVMKRAVVQVYKFSPRATQLLTLLILLNPAPNKGRLAQVNTGEGKSMIVAMLAAIHALKGAKVDVVTTSTELSIPEVRKQRPFFKLLTLTVDENSPESEKKAVYGCDVVYGTESDFQGDVLRTEFLGNDCRGSRTHQVVIVDEVDSMLYDSRTHSVRLADECPGMTHLEVPLAVIWEFIHNARKHMIARNEKVYFIAEDFEVVGKQIRLYSGNDWETVATVVDDTKNFIIKHGEEHLRKLLRTLTGSEQTEYEEYQEMSLRILAKEEEISQKPESEQDDLKKECEVLQKRLLELPWNKRDPIVEIPEHLRVFSLAQVSSWVKNAILAAWGYKKDAHYTVLNGRIVPVNFNETGVLQTNMIWSDGLTQFLQLKEGLRMDPEGISTNFISNVSFFQRYGSNIFGLTGTLGERSTHDFLHTMYGTDMIVIPPYKQIVIRNNEHSAYRCKELVPLVFSDQGRWYCSVKENALYHAHNQRGVLIICKFISQARSVSNILKKVYDPHKIFTYTGDSVTFDKDTIESGEIIIATNIAGRGTDLKTSKNVEKHGGMCVLVTFLPESFRVEMQNVGRTAREGKRGMAQLIVQDNNNTPMETLKALREVQETNAIATAIKDARKMLIQDALFQRFCQLETRFLPSFDDTRKVQFWNILTVSWAYYSTVHLDPRKVAEKSSQWAEVTKADLIEKSLQTLTTDQRAKLTDKDHQELRKEVAEQVAIMKPDFEARYRENVKSQFCSKHSSNIPEELLDCFKKGTPYQSKYNDSAKQFNWSAQERKGAEESWGLWLKSKHFEESEMSMEQATNAFDEEFVKDFEKRAEDDDLIRNPFYYVLKGNDYLVAENISEAEACYNRAIRLDPIFSVNARYNKAQALLTYPTNKGDKQREALKELKKAKDIIASVYRPSLLTFNTLIAQQACSVSTSEHVQHQLNVLSQHEDYIENACQVIESALKNDNNVKIELKNLSKVLSEAKEDHEKAIREATTNGLKHMFTVEEKLPRPWKSIIGVALIGIAQIGAGCLIVACTGGALGSGLIAEGVSDMITSIRSAITGTFSWAAWAAQKIISIAVSIVCAGIGSIKSGMTAVKNTAKDLMGQAAVGTAKRGVELAAKEVGLALAKGIVKECLTEASKFCTDQLFMNKLEEEISKKVGDKLTTALLNNPLVVKALEDDQESGSCYWKQQFIKEGLGLLKDKQVNECIRIIKEIMKGVAASKIPFAGSILSIAGVADMLKKLLTYTDKFIVDFNAKVSNYKNKIQAEQSSTKEKTQNSKATTSSDQQNSTTQQTIISDAPDIDIDDSDINVHLLQENTSYSSKAPCNSNAQLRSRFVEASTPESLANAFKGQIAGKLTASIHENLVNPVMTKVTSSVTNGLFASTEATVAKLRSEIKTERDYRSTANDLANAKKNKSSDTKSQPKETELGEHSKRAIREISTEGHVHDTSSLALAAAEVEAPIHVYDEHGKLKYVVGDKLPGKPITIKHFAPSDEHPLGHFAPLDPKYKVTPSGKNTCALDSVVTQLSTERKESLRLTDASDLRGRLVENIKNNPRAAEKTFETQDQLRTIAHDRILQGGAIKKSQDENRDQKRQKKSVRKLPFNDPQVQADVREVLGDEIEEDSSTMNEAERKEYQIHHPLHQKFRNHEAVKNSGVDIVNHPMNRIALPVSDEVKNKYETDRSKHKGRHTNVVANQQKQQLDRILEQGQREGWNPQQYKIAVYRVMYNERQEVRKGKDLYEKTPKKSSKRDKEQREE